MRILQEVNNFLYFLFSTSLSSHVLKGNANVITLFVHLCFTLTNIEDATACTTSSSTHSAHE